MERRLSDLVDAAYGLMPEDVALMWSTAPPPHAAAAACIGYSATNPARPRIAITSREDAPNRMNPCAA